MLTGCAVDKYHSAGGAISTPIEIGMSTEQVKAIMGEPYRSSNIYYNHRLKEQVWEWSYPVKEFSLFHTECYLIIYFKDDKVIDIREWTPGL